MKANRAAIRKLADLLKKAGPAIAEENEALQWAFDSYADHLNTILTTSVSRNTKGRRKPALFVVGVDSVGAAPQRDRPNSVEFTQPRLPSSSSTSHISPFLLPVG